MNIETVPISSLMPDPANVRLHSDRNIATIKASLARFGQQKPIVVDANNVVRAGNGTLLAAAALGWDTVQIVRTALTGSEATAFAIVDNRSGDPEVGSTWDSAALAATLAALNAENPDLVAATGFDPTDLAALLAVPTDTSEPPDAFGTVGEDIPTEYECPRCHYKWSGGAA
jgi:ParB-like chromosome segregation protein Spo0J